MPLRLARIFLDGIKINQNFLNEILEKSCKAVNTALKFKKSARAELFQITSYPAINRRLPVPWILKFNPYYFKKRCLNKPNRKVISDKSCQSIKFTLKDKSCFWLLNAAAHPTNYNGNKISSDFPYYIEKSIIQLSTKNSCLGALFLQGWAGDQNSDLTKNISINSNPISLFEKIFIKQSFNRSLSKENLDNLGEKIAKSLLKAKRKKLLSLKIKKISSEKIKLSLIDKKSIS